MKRKINLNRIAGMSREGLNRASFVPGHTNPPLPTHRSTPAPTRPPRAPRPGGNDLTSLNLESVDPKYLEDLEKQTFETGQVEQTEHRYNVSPLEEKPPAPPLRPAQPVSGRPRPVQPQISKPAAPPAPPTPKYPEHRVPKQVPPRRVIHRPVAAAEKGNKDNKSDAAPTGVPVQVPRPDLHTPAAWQEDASKIYDEFAEDSKKMLDKFEPPAHKPVHVAAFRNIIYDPENYSLHFEVKTPQGGNIHYNFQGISQKIASEFRRLNRSREAAKALNLIKENSDHAPVLRALGPPRRHALAIEIEKLEEGDTVFHPADLSQNLEAWSFAGPGEGDGEIRLVRQSENDDTKWEEIVVDSDSVEKAEDVLEELSGAVQNREGDWPEFQAESEDQEGMAEFQESAPQTPAQGQKPGEADRPTANRDMSNTPAGREQELPLPATKPGGSPTNRPPGQEGAF